MKKILIIAVLLSALGNFLNAAAKDENLLVNDDRIFALSNKYTSMISSLYEEETAKLGLNVYNYDATLINRDTKSETAKIKALEAMSQNLNDIRVKSLSTYAQADYYTLKELIGLNYFETKTRNQFELDPLWYLQPMDTVYTMLLRNFLSGQDRLDYALKRLNTMPDVVQKAAINITKPYDLNLKLAIEKINLEIANLPSLAVLMSRINNDKYTKARINQATKEAENALNKYKNFLQNKLKNQEHIDFRLGNSNYKHLFNKVYMVPFKYGNLESTLKKNFNRAKEDLIEGIEGPILDALTDEQKEERFIKNKIQIYPQDYYMLAKNYKEAPKYDKVLQAYSQDITNTDEFVVNNNLFPTLSLPITLMSAPPIFRDGPSTVIVYPPAPMADVQSGNILVSLPKGVNLNKEDYRYNYSQIKFNTAEFITPGQTLIYSVEPVNSSLLYKLSNDIFYVHGWVKYALDTAYENGLFDSEMDQINYRWFNYTKAVYALAEYKLQTKDFDYDSAIAFITNAGIGEEEAKANLNYLALKPFDAVSYIIGAQEFERLRIKYKKQLGKKFDLSTFHTKILSVGRIPLTALEKSLAKTYAEKEVDSMFNVTYF